jgi:hypothetical protein
VNFREKWKFNTKKYWTFVRSWKSSQVPGLSLREIAQSADFNKAYGEAANDTSASFDGHVADFFGF